MKIAYRISRLSLSVVGTRFKLATPRPLDVCSNWTELTEKQLIVLFAFLIGDVLGDVSKSFG